jgi:AraC-like DNA-binding protein
MRRRGSGVDDAAEPVRTKHREGRGDAVQDASSAATAMSPLQYQKQLRLHEARRLMLTDKVDAATAAYKVGYESSSQFSREYGRLFGAPPLRDIAQWKAGFGLI